jgi:TolB-like protein/Flp pilus assembly protein TadD
LSLFNELKRRNVFRVVIAYVVVAWLMLQVADVILNNVEAPGWVFHVILLCMGIGLILVAVFSWAFEMTPEGIKRESEVDRSQSITPQTGQKLNHLIIILLVLALAYFVIDKFVLSAQRESTAIEAALQEASDNAANEQATAEGAESVAAAESDRSIAVLPFADMSPEKDQEYFSDGLSEELLNLLAKIPELRVAARTSAFSYKGTDAKIDQVGRELGVAHVLEGSVRTAGNRIRVTAQLIKADDGFHVWSETYDRTMDDVFTIQDEIASAVVAALKVTLLGEAPRVSETSPEAYALYLQARYLSNQLRPEVYEEAVSLYRQVLKLDSAYAPAYVGLGRTYRNMTVDDQLSTEEGFRLARQMFAKALELDPNLAEAHARMGSITLGYDQDPEASIKYYQRAMELNPNDPAVIQGVATLTILLGDYETGVKLSELAVQRDPVDVVGYQELAGAYALTGRLEDARRTYVKLLTLNPQISAGWYRLGIVHLRMGNIDEALAAFEKESDEEYRVKGRTLCAHARGDQQEFKTLFTELRDRWGNVWPSEIAHVYAWTGNPDAAFEWLDKAVSMAEGGIMNSRQVALLDPLHEDPRWQTYLEQLGITDAQLANIKLDVKLPAQGKTERNHDR